MTIDLFPGFEVLGSSQFRQHESFECVSVDLAQDFLRFGGVLSQQLRSGTHRCHRPIQQLMENQPGKERWRQRSLGVRQEREDSDHERCSHVGQRRANGERRLHLAEG